MPFHAKPPLFSVFAALQDVTMDMGPTIFLPGTISVAEQGQWAKDDDISRDAFLRAHTPYFALLKAGDVVVYDPRVLHCGAANDASRGSTRAIFNFGFRHPEFSGNMGYTGSLRPGYVNKISLEDVTAGLLGLASGVTDPFSAFGDGIMRLDNINS